MAPGEGTELVMAEEFPVAAAVAPVRTLVRMQ